MQWFFYQLVGWQVRTTFRNESHYIIDLHRDIYHFAESYTRALTQANELGQSRISQHLSPFPLTHRVDGDMVEILHNDHVIERITLGELTQEEFAQHLCAAFERLYEQGRDTKRGYNKSIGFMLK